MKIKYILYLILLGILVYYGVGYFTTTKHKTGDFVIAHDKTFYPLDLLGKEVDIETFCNHLIEKVAIAQDIGITVEVTTSDKLLPGLESKQYDAILVPVLEEWSDVGRYYFSVPLFSLGPVLVIRAEETEASLEDFKGKTIGVVRTSPLMGKLSGMTEITVAPYDRLFDAMEALSNDRIDGLVMDALQAYVYTEGFYHGKLRIFQPALNKAGIQLVTMRTPRAKTFIDAFNKGLIELFQNGGYQSLLDYWGFTNFPRPPLKELHPLSLDKTAAP